MEKIKRFFASKFAILGLFTIISTLLAIPLVVLVSQDKQTTQADAASSVEGAMTGIVSGYIYTDSNGNGQRDPEEKAYPNATIKITTKENNTYPSRDLRADSFGYFTYKFTNENQSQFQIKLIVPEGYKMTTPNPVVVQKTQKQILEFGVFGSPVVTVTPKLSCTPRPACLDSVPRCLVAEPTSGWCPVVSIYPTKPFITERKMIKTTIEPTGKITK